MLHYLGGHSEINNSKLDIGALCNWTQSFFTGMAYWSYKVTKDEKFLKWNCKFFDDYYKKVFETPFETMEEYLETSINLAKKFIELCEDDGIPVWDFRLPEDKPAMYCGLE